MEVRAQNVQAALYFLSTCRPSGPRALPLDIKLKNLKINFSPLSLLAFTSTVHTHAMTA